MSGGTTDEWVEVGPRKVVQQAKVYRKAPPHVERSKPESRNVRKARATVEAPQPARVIVLDQSLETPDCQTPVLSGMSWASRLKSVKCDQTEDPALGGGVGLVYKSVGPLSEPVVFVDEAAGGVDLKTSPRPSEELEETAQPEQPAAAVFGQVTLPTHVPFKPTTLFPPSYTPPAAPVEYRQVAHAIPAPPPNPQSPDGYVRCADKPPAPPRRGGRGRRGGNHMWLGPPVNGYFQPVPAYPMPYPPYEIPYGGLIPAYAYPHWAYPAGSPYAYAQQAKLASPQEEDREQPVTA